MTLSTGMVRWRLWKRVHSHISRWVRYHICFEMVTLLMESIVVSMLNAAAACVACLRCPQLNIIDMATDTISRGQCQEGQCDFQSMAISKSPSTSSNFLLPRTNQAGCTCPIPQSPIQHICRVTPRGSLGKWDAQFSLTIHNSYDWRSVSTKRGNAVEKTAIVQSWSKRKGSGTIAGILELTNMPPCSDYL